MDQCIGIKSDGNLGRCDVKKHYMENICISLISSEIWFRTSVTELERSDSIFVLLNDESFRWKGLSQAISYEIEITIGQITVKRDLEQSSN